jgi:hypothetical protein
MTVVFLLFVAVIIYAGRLNVANAHVEAAARSAARSISVARDPYAAARDAEAEAESNVTAGSTLCSSVNVNVTPGDLSPGTEVTVVVTCNVDMSSVLLLDVPGTTEVRGTAVEVIDVHRSGT